MANNTDIVLQKVTYSFENIELRTPLKFGTGIITELTYAHATVEVRNREGAQAVGEGGVLLSDLWAFPSSSVSHADRDEAMRDVCRRVGLLYEGASGHPIDIVMKCKKSYPSLADEVTRDRELGDTIPLLAAMVCASPVDAAVHDAFGRVNGISTYAGYGPQYWDNDLELYLGSEFHGMRLQEFVGERPVKTVPIFHLVGGADKLIEPELDGSEIEDGRPHALQQWIQRDGVYCFKVKLTGTDIGWDLQRTGEVFKVAGEELQKRGRENLYLSVDSNEMCPDPEAVVEYLRKLRERYPEAYDALLYVEQPTERDLQDHAYDMHDVAALKPVLADEGITSVQDLKLARKLGWSGVALKTCKGHTSVMLCVAAASMWGMLYSVQDLTNPGVALAHSVGLAARVSPIRGVEANARQFLKQPELGQNSLKPFFHPTDGVVSTSILSEVGLDY